MRTCWILGSLLVAAGTVFAASACEPAAKRPARGATALLTSSAGNVSAAPSAGNVRISLLGTNDLHGHIAALPLYAGYINNLRKVRAADGGAVVLADAGDMFQGTLESNTVEGLSVVRAYAALGMHAVAIGNHEFDFGPVGPHAVPSAGEDPRGALKAAAAAAPYPFLLANALENSAAPNWPNILPRTVITAAGLKIGFVGVTTRETLTTTLGANVSDLRLQSLASAVKREALLLREKEHCDLVIALTHAGGKCARFTGSIAADGCEDHAEAFKLARELGRGTVDAIIGGHTHAGVAHEVEGTPIIESFSHGRAFGRIDFDISLSSKRIEAKRIFAPQSLCREQKDADPESCASYIYEGQPVVRDAGVGAIVAKDLASAAARKAELIGVSLPDGLRRDYDDESPMGNAFCDLVLAATPDAQVAILNGGGLRANLPRGPLTYGALFEAFPFDNRVARIRTTYGNLRKVVRSHMRAKGGIFSFAGVQVNVICREGKADVDFVKPDGSVPADGDALTIVTSEFLAQGGDEFWGEGANQGGVSVSDELMRDVLDQQLRRKSVLEEKSHFDRNRRRIVFPAGKRRPVICER